MFTSSTLLTFRTPRGAEIYFYLIFLPCERFGEIVYAVAEDNLSFTSSNYDKTKQNGNVNFIWLLRIRSYQMRCQGHIW